MSDVIQNSNRRIIIGYIRKLVRFQKSTSLVKSRGKIKASMEEAESNSEQLKNKKKKWSFLKRLKI